MEEELEALGRLGSNVHERWWRLSPKWCARDGGSAVTWCLAVPTVAPRSTNYFIVFSTALQFVRIV
jgi:hypothetical protein